MPNWCYNRVEIHSENPEDLKQIKSIFESQRPFHQIIPEPDWLNIPAETDLKDTADNPIAKKGELPIQPDPDSNLTFASTGRADDRWYNWRINNWGIKWDLDTRDIELLDWDDYQITYTFETPWGPPEYICSALREKYKDISITWFFDEPGCELAGYL
tara:strand:+ start:67 stop:540 length:474 start_codon:yes stop_codon:yes gene_type:complete